MIIKFLEHMEITRHFTVTTTIVCGNKVLLHFHKKLNKWIPIGGHIDRDELPEDAAIREAKEEAGIEIVLYDTDSDMGIRESKQLIKPAHIVLHDINPYHQHIDFTFFARTNTFMLKPGKGETKNLRWFTEDEIKKTDMIDNAKFCALEALKLLGK
jgi:8-oxo-dGTP pyrophosphatase MutT (NUDIX family)